MVLAPQQIINLKLSTKNRKKVTLAYFGNKTQARLAVQLLFTSTSERERFFRLFNIHISSAIRRPTTRRDMSICASEYQPTPLQITLAERKRWPVRRLRMSFQQCKMWTNTSGVVFVEAFVGSILALGFSVVTDKKRKISLSSNGSNGNAPPNNAVSSELRQFREFMAESMHDAWAAQKLKEGWKFCPSHHPAKLQHPNLIPYVELANETKQRYLKTADLLLACLEQYDCHITKLVDQ